MQHPLPAGAWQAAILTLGRQQSLEQSLIVDFQLIAAATLVDQVSAVGGNQFVEGRHIGAHRAGGDIEAASQLLLWQRFGVELDQQLMEPGVWQLDHRGYARLLLRDKGSMLTSGSSTSQAPVSD